MPPANLNFDFQPVVYSRMERNDMTRRSSTKSRSPERLDDNCTDYNLTDPSRKRRSRRHTLQSYTRLTTLNFFVLLALCALYHGYRQSDDLLSHRARNTLVIPEKTVGDYDAHERGGLHAVTATLLSQAKVPRQPEIVHIIHTRFMQNQPDLIELGFARLEMFKAFCVSSLKKQSSQNFLWVIRTDPDLDASIREALLEILQEDTHHLLIADNENPNIQVSELLSLDPKNVWSGDFQRAKSYLEPATGDSGLYPPVLESRLDADDGLHMDFVENLQNKAKTAFVSSAPQWRIWCATRNVEWQYHMDWKTGKIDPKLGGLISLRLKGCISAGLTIGYTPGITPRDLPKIKHQQLYRKVKHCKEGAPLEVKSHCLDLIHLSPTALRARTPTSAGMLNVLSNATDGSDARYLKGAQAQELQQGKLWQIVEERFGYTMEAAKGLHGYLESHLREIAIDNLKGQCTSGHSCKDSSRALLESIIGHTAT